MLYVALTSPSPRVKVIVMGAEMVSDALPEPDPDPEEALGGVSVTVIVTDAGPNVAFGVPETTQLEPLAATLSPPGEALGAVKAQVYGPLPLFMAMFTGP